MNSRPVTNDNIETRRHYNGEAECLPHMQAARYLIDRYISAYWKRSVNDPGFVHMELTLCRYLLMDTKCAISRNLKIKWIARVLDIEPLRLSNDPGLPF